MRPLAPHALLLHPTKILFSPNDLQMTTMWLPSEIARTSRNLQLELCSVDVVRLKLGQTTVQDGED